MHFILAWDSEAPDRRSNEIENQIEGCIKIYAYVSPIQNVYLIQVRSSKDYERIQNGLTLISETFESDDMNFIMSPLMKGGTYDGIVPEDLWAAINNITK